MSALRAFLKEQATALRETEAECAEAVAEWKTALQSLLDRLEHWLREADPRNILSIRRIPVVVRQRRLGIYDVNGLEVRLGDRSVRVKPASRYSSWPSSPDEPEMMAGDGGVIISGPNGRYTVYRRKNEDGDEWIIAECGIYNSQILDQAAFEDAILRLLK